MKNPMESWVGKFPQFLLKGYRESQIPIALPPGASVSEIIFCGMGGSAVPAMLLKNLFPSLPCPMQVHTSDGLPQQHSRNPYVVVVSYSGNTEESLSSFKSLIKLGLKGIAITSNGRLREDAQKNNFPYLLLPEGMAPRSALPFILSAEIALLEQLFGKTLKGELLRSADFLQKHQKNLRERAKQIAHSIHRHSGIILIWGVTGISDAVAYRWRTQLNENAKQFASTHNFPELTHNEIVPLSTAIQPFTILTLETNFDGKQNALRREKALELLGATPSSSSLLFRIPVKALGKNRLAQLLSLLWMGDWVSLYLAELLEVNPVPIVVIEKLKERMNPKRGPIARIEKTIPTSNGIKRQ